MKKIMLILCTCLITGCTSFVAAIDDLDGYRFPYMAQLRGHHISEVLNRLDGIELVEEAGILHGNRYRLFYTRQYDHTVNTYNYYGALINQQDVYHSGEILLETDAQGYITRYIENGYIPLEDGDFDHTLRDALRDILVFDQ